MKLIVESFVHSMFRTSAESRLIKARHRPHDSNGLSRTPLMYRQQAEPREPVARARARVMWTGLDAFLILPLHESYFPKVRVGSML
ncbi:hypothetical protein B7P43_G08001 [Cryptotermes secundus]|uniref:Uncharacterized protein n=1 Tax=Cryptotermes secundus TaxID=105785 RepID=A0A2J7PHT3_9NEOP|nr:hypothetical protein B7P43_G08001 [Cryptotermes secundus]